MTEQLVLTGLVTVNSTATENTLVNIDPVKSILSGYVQVEDTTSGVSVSTALIVVTGAPANNLEIQRTAQNKFKLYLTTGLIAKDTLVLDVEMVGEQVRP